MKHDPLHIVVCEYFKEEISAISSLNEFKDIQFDFYPARCGYPAPEKNSSQNPFTDSLVVAGNDNVLFGCRCVSENECTNLELHNFRIIKIDCCFELFLPKTLIDHLLLSAAYLVTPGWLSSWEEKVEKWGNPEHLKQMFSESISRIVLIDTGTDPQSENKLRKFSEAFGRPAEIIPAGLDHLKLHLGNCALKGRIDMQVKNSEQRQSSENGMKKDSDYALAFDLLGDLPKTMSEVMIIKRITEFFEMLFAPGSVNYLTIHSGKPGTLWRNSEKTDDTVKCTQLLSYRDRSMILDNRKGFTIIIGKNEDLVGIAEISNVAVPHYLNHYFNLSVSVAGIFLMAVTNARNFEKIQQINSQLSEAVATKDKFLSIIGHDLKGPFSTISGLTGILLENKDLPESEITKDILWRISDTSNQATFLLENLLLWAMSHNGQMVINPVEVDPAQIIKNVVSDSMPAAALKKISLASDILPGLLIMTDKNMLTTVLRNLISNAIKFTGDGGKIVVSAKLNDNMVLVSVTDNGVGIPKEAISKLFRMESAISTNGTKNEKGTGLGLILCNEFIEKQYGRLWVESEPGKGSSFKFTLPAR